MVIIGSLNDAGRRRRESEIRFKQRVAVAYGKLESAGPTLKAIKAKVLRHHGPDKVHMAHGP